MLFVFPLSIGYAPATQDLRRIKMLLRRSVYSLTGLVLVALFLGTGRPEARAALPSVEHWAKAATVKRLTMTSKSNVARTVQQPNPLLIKTMLLVCRHDFIPGCSQRSVQEKKTPGSSDLASASLPSAASRYLLFKMLNMVTRKIRTNSVNQFFGA